MPIRAFIQESAFDPEAVAILNDAYLAVCADLGLSDHTDGATQIVAEKVIELANEARDPQQLRAAVLASFKCAA